MVSSISDMSAKSSYLMVLELLENFYIINITLYTRLRLKMMFMIRCNHGYIFHYCGTNSKWWQVGNKVLSGELKEHCNPHAIRLIQLIELRKNLTATFIYVLLFIHLALSLKL